MPAMFYPQGSTPETLHDLAWLLGFCWRNGFGDQEIQTGSEAFFSIFARWCGAGSFAWLACISQDNYSKMIILLMVKTLCTSWDWYGSLLCHHLLFAPRRGWMNYQSIVPWVLQAFKLYNYKSVFLDVELSRGMKCLVIVRDVRSLVALSVAFFNFPAWRRTCAQDEPLTPTEQPSETMQIQGQSIQANWFGARVFVRKPAQ